MKKVKLTKKNIENIDCNSVILYSYADIGAMGKPGEIAIVTKDNKVYYGNYVYENLNIENFYRALPSLNNKEYRQHWKMVNLGMGNSLNIRKEFYDNFMKIVEEKVPEYPKQKVKLFQNWISCSEELLKRYDLKVISLEEPKATQFMNPFKSMGFDFDINDRTFQKKLVDYIEKNNSYTLYGYNDVSLNAYSDKKNSQEIQLNLIHTSEDMTLTEKVNNLFIHHTTPNVWKNKVDIVLAGKGAKCIVNPCISNSKGAAVIQYINDNTYAYIQKGNKIYSQISCFAYEMRIFKDSEVDENKNFSFKLNDGPDKEIYLGNNNIMMCAISGKDNDLNYIKGEILEISEIKQTLFGQTAKYYMMLVDTEFGVTPIICSDSVISYKYNNQISVGDNIEAKCSITGDLMIVPDKTTTIRDKEHYFDLIKKAFERGNMDILKGIISEDCIYKSSNHNVKGKKEVIAKLQYITNEGYKNKDVELYYAEISENPVANFKIGEEVLCLGYSENGEYKGIEGEINIKLNKDNRIDKIYFTDDPNIKFKIYNEDGSISLTDEEKKYYQELYQLLKDREIPQSDIYGILTLTLDEVFIVQKTMEFIKNYDKDNSKIVSDILGYQYKLTEKYENQHPHRKKLRINDMSSNEEYVPYKDREQGWSLYNLDYHHYNDNGVLNITCSDSTAGTLKILSGTKMNIVIAKLLLPFGSLKDIDNNKRSDLSKIDLYCEGTPSYSFNKNIEYLEAHFNDYEHINFWINNSKNSEEYLLIRFFVNYFYKLLKEKDVNIYACDLVTSKESFDDLTQKEYAKIILKPQKLTKEILKEYKNEWDKIKTIDCDIRQLENGEIKYYKKEDFYSVILDALSKEGEIKRNMFIGNLLGKYKIFNFVDVGLYSYLIDEMIKEGLISSTDYTIPQFIPADKIKVIEKNYN